MCAVAGHVHVNAEYLLTQFIIKAVKEILDHPITLYDLRTKDTFRITTLKIISTEE